MSGETKKGKSTGIIMLLAVILIFAIAAVYCYSYYNDRVYKPLSSAGNAKTKEVIIKSGETSEKIAETLLNEGLIKDKNIFILYLKISKQGSSMKAGKYELNTGMAAVDIVNKLVKGEVKRDTIKVTIPEGFEIKDIATVFEKAGLVSKDKFIEVAQTKKFDYDFLKGLPERQIKLEGYLFPDTYEFSKDATPEQIITKMLDRFSQVFNDEMKKKAAKMNLSIDKVVTMASIIEREAKVESERPIIAAVFYNRIKSSMRLQSCATVQYALGERKEKLLYKDLEVESPYNTYKNDGLPVGPIANPGKASIEAALEPANVNYLFFVLKDNITGTHAFTVDYDDFLREKEKSTAN